MVLFRKLELTFVVVLCAGTGSQIHVYDVHTGLLINSFRIFEGIRVHGIFCCESGLQVPVSPAPPIIMAVYGEKNVKLFSLFIEFPNDKSATGFWVEITLIYSLPNLGHWVMDVRFLNVLGLLSSFFFSMFLIARFLKSNW